MSTEFFPGQRRKIELADWQPLRNEQDEKRIRFDLLMPLTGQSYKSMPSFLAPSFEKMELEGSAIKDTELLTQIEDVTLELYATDQSGPLEVEWGIGLDEAEAEARDRKRKLLLTRCTLRNFKVLRVKRGEDSIVASKFSVTTRSTRGLAAWAHDYNGKTVWCEFSIDSSPGQTTIAQVPLPLKGSELVAEPKSFEERERCPVEFCVGDLNHAGDHEDALGTKINVIVIGKKAKVVQ